MTIPIAKPAEADRVINPVAILAIVLVSYFMILLDNSGIFTALPTIRSGLNLSITGLSWVQDGVRTVRQRGTRRREALEPIRERVVIGARFGWDIIDGKMSGPTRGPSRSSGSPTRRSSGSAPTSSISSTNTGSIQTCPSKTSRGR
jgi:hypothetical protein